MECGQPPASAPLLEALLLELLDPLGAPELPEPLDPPLLEPVAPLEPPPLLDPDAPSDPLLLEPASLPAPAPLSLGALTCELLDPLLHAPTTATAAKRAIHSEDERTCDAVR
jgi:hypothetical protein